MSLKYAQYKESAERPTLDPTARVSLIMWFIRASLIDPRNPCG